MVISRMWSVPLGFLLAGLVGCTSVSVGDTQNTVNVTVQGSYQKRTPSGNSRGSLESRPTRYTFVEFRKNSDSTVLASAALGANGTGTASIPRGASVYAVLWADVLAPTASGTGFSLHGSVKKARLASSYASGEEFRDVLTWGTTSSTFLADADGTLTIQALESTS